jgi:hypothetical protein
MYIAQAELLLGRWQPAWAAYARRSPRREFERAAAARGATYAIPSIEALAGCDVTVVGEQGLGDSLFFLRWVPLLRQAGARVRFAGEPRLHSLLARTGLFDGFDAAERAVESRAPILVGDLPALFADVDPLGVASLRLAPLPERVAAWEAQLRAAGPRPWVGAQWRAGTPRHRVAHALLKSVPVEPLFAALAPAGGTLVALQRGIAARELEAAARAAGRPVLDFSRVNDDLEDVLALVTLLDHHVAVSSTTMHLAAAAGVGADVLVPFPPEWRWRLEGACPWFPGFRVHRQPLDGDWSQALAGAVRGG